MSNDRWMGWLIIGFIAVFALWKLWDPDKSNMPIIGWKIPTVWKFEKDKHLLPCGIVHCHVELRNGKRTSLILGISGVSGRKVLQPRWMWAHHPSPGVGTPTQRPKVLFMATGEVRTGPSEWSSDDPILEPRTTSNGGFSCSQLCGFLWLHRMPSKKNAGLSWFHQLKVLEKVGCLCTFFGYPEAKLVKSYDHQHPVVRTLACWFVIITNLVNGKQIPVTP